MEIKTIFDILLSYKENCPDKQDALAQKINGRWLKYSINEYYDIVENLAIGLYALGINKGDKVATISQNCPQWNFIDMATARIGAIHVSIYTNIIEQDIKYILNHSEAKIIFVSDEEFYKKVKQVYYSLEIIPLIFTFDEIEYAHNYDEIISLGVKRQEKYHNTILENYELLKPNEIRSIIYTSGTTGRPKGVMLSHNNFISNLLATKDLLPLDNSNRVISFLPISHVLERMLNYLYQYKHISIYYAESISKLSENLKEVKPHGFVTVPRLIERVYERLENQTLNLKGIKKFIYKSALKFAEKYPENGKLTIGQKRKRLFYDRLIYKHWRNALGGNLKLIIVGGAALQTRLAKAFRMANIKLSEGYGLTETSPVVSVNHENFPNFKFGTVGPILKNVKVKIADDGEILVKGPNVMLGYYKDPKQTREVIDQESWFHTGDIGEIIENKFLKITDRKKSIFKLSTGLYIAPQQIETQIKTSEYIDQAMVIGEKEKFVSALIVPHFEKVYAKADELKLIYNSIDDLLSFPQIKTIFNYEIEKINSKLNKTQKIKKFVIVNEEWSINSGELSPTLKLKRKFIFNKYKNLIKDIYAK